MATREEFLAHPTGMYTDLAGLNLWYGKLAPGRFPGLPPAVQKGLANFEFATLIPVPRKEAHASQIAKKALNHAVSSIQRWNWAEHNMRHFVEVRDFAKALWFEYCKSAKINPDICLYIWQIMEPALLMHDVGHCGSTLLADAPGGHPFKKLGPNISLEWLSTLEVVEFSQQQGLKWPEIALQAALIESSTFAGGDAAKRGIRNIPNITVGDLKHVVSLIMRIADVMIHREPLISIARGICVKMLEVPANLKERISPDDTDAYRKVLNNQAAFYPHVTALFDRFKVVTGYDVAGKLGWRKIVKDNIEAIRDLQNTTGSDLEKDIRAMIADPRRAVHLRNHY